MPLTASTAPSASQLAAARTASPGAPTAIGSPAPSSSRARRAARRAGVRLGVEAPVAGIVVLAPAGGAHREAGHGRGGPVVRHAAHDREARPAVRAVDERVAEAAVGGIAQLGEAVVAGRRVGRDERVGLAARDALDDAEVALAGRLRAGRTRRSRRQRAGRLARQAREKALDGGRPPVHLEHDPALVVEHESAELLLAREPVDERTEADALHDALDASAHARRRSRQLQLHELAQQVRGRGLRLLDARDVLRAADDEVVGEAVGGHAPAVVARRTRSSRGPACAPRPGHR